MNFGRLGKGFGKWGSRPNTDWEAPPPSEIFIVFENNDHIQLEDESGAILSEANP